MRQLLQNCLLVACILATGCVMACSAARMIWGQSHECPICELMNSVNRMLIDRTPSDDPVAAGLQHHLEMDRRDAELLANQMLPSEQIAILRYARWPASVVGMAAVVYRARMRLAGSNRRRLKAAHDEADRHARLFERHARPAKAALPGSQTRTVYHAPLADHLLSEETHAPA